MKMYVGVTDKDWFEILKAEKCDEVNFWKPGTSNFKALDVNDLFLFKLHAPYNFIVGGGFFVRFTILPTFLAWDSFGIKNGTYSLQQLNVRIQKYRARNGITESNPSIGCIILTEPFFFDEQDWIPVPEDWKNSIVQGKTYSTDIRFFTHGISVGTLLKSDTDAVVNGIQDLYYSTRIEEIQTEIGSIEQKLEKLDSDALMAELKEMSLRYFRSELAKKYKYKKTRKTFAVDELWKEPQSFLKEYPVVLSTTYTARSSLGRDARFDYVIMDEASQIDVATGLLSLSCAKNAVIVGDIKQLSNIVPPKQRGPLSVIFQKHNVPNAYDYAENNFLQSVCALLGNQIPQVTLVNMILIFTMPLRMKHSICGRNTGRSRYNSCF